MEKKRFYDILILGSVGLLIEIVNTVLVTLPMKSSENIINGIIGCILIVVWIFFLKRRKWARIVLIAIGGLFIFAFGGMILIAVFPAINTLVGKSTSANLLQCVSQSWNESKFNFLYPCYYIFLFCYVVRPKVKEQFR